MSVTLGSSGDLMLLPADMQVVVAIAGPGSIAYMIRWFASQVEKDRDQHRKTLDRYADISDKLVQVNMAQLERMNEQDERLRELTQKISDLEVTIKKRGRK